MPIRFAAAGSGECAVVARVLCMPRIAPAANDTAAPLSHGQLLHAALRHFAAHGLSAAARAHDEAMAARAAGDLPAHGHWLAICRLLDRRLAADTPAPVLRQG